MHDYTLLRWAATLVLGLFGGFLIFINIRILYTWIARRKHHSWIPLVGGFVAMVGMGVCPLRQVRQLAWVPLAIDISYCVFMLAAGLLTAWLGRTRRSD